MIGNIFDIFQRTGKIKIGNDKGFGALGEEVLLKEGSVVLNPPTERRAWEGSWILSSRSSSGLPIISFSL